MQKFVNNCLLIEKISTTVHGNKKHISTVILVQLKPMRNLFSEYLYLMSNKQYKFISLF